MSTESLFWSLEQRLPPGPKLVLIYLGDQYNKNHGFAWPKHWEIAEWTGYSVPTVKRHVQWLIDNGLVKKEKQIYNGRQRSNRYYLPVNVMAFQGVQNELPGGFKMSYPVAQNELPSNTLNNTLKNTPKGADAHSEESDMKFKPGGTVTDNMNTADEYWGMDKAEVMLKVRKGIRDGEIKPSSLEKLWRYSRACANDIDYGKNVAFNGKEFGQMKLAWDRLGEDLLDVVWNVMSDWAGFCRAAEKEAGAFKSPTKPNVVYFTKYIEVAVNFTPAEQDNLDGWITTI